MAIALLRLVLFIGHSNSLKTKRMVLHSLKARIRNAFNVAISEVDDEDKWQKSTLMVVGVEKDKRYIDREFNKIVNFIERFHQVSLIDYEMEMI